MRTLLFALTSIALTISVSAQDLDSLISEASKPVPVDFAVGLSLMNSAAEALADAGLASALPPRISAATINDRGVLSARSQAERELSSRGTGVIATLVAAEIDQPVGLWISAGVSPDTNLVPGEIRGLNIARIVNRMGPAALAELERMAGGSGAVAERAATLHDELSELDALILPSGLVRVEGETTNVNGLAGVVAKHELARSALVTAPGDLPLNLAIPVLDALRAAGLENVELQSASDSVVTISDQE